MVLGGSRGLGFAIAKCLVREGASVMLCGRIEASLKTAALSLSSNGGCAEYRVVDLADHESVSRLLEKISGDSRGYSILINNSGGPPPGPISSETPEKWEYFFRSMVVSLVRITNKLLPEMTLAEYGRIINIVSSGVIQPIPNLGLSNSLRSALLSWSKTLSVELAPKGITVNCVAPGRIHTERIDQLDKESAVRSGRSQEEVEAESRRNIPIGRYGEPNEFADAVAFLCSVNASYITGAVLRIDGGLIKCL